MNPNLIESKLSSNQKNPQTIKELFDTKLSKVDRRTNLERRLEESTVLITELASLYRDTYHRIRAMADDHYMPNWCDFKFERVGVELIPTMIEYQIERQSPYGAYDAADIRLIVGSYLPKLRRMDCERVWFTAHSVLWEELGLNRDHLQRIAFRIENGMLFHYKLDVEATVIENTLFT